MANICEYYPCHKNPCIGFDCTYCMCPLYEKDCEKLGGTPEYIKINRGEVKDCSNCQLPHTTDFLTNYSKDSII